MATAKRVEFLLGLLFMLAITSSVDDGIRPERCPGEPEVVAVNDGRQAAACQRAGDGLAQDVPSTSRFLIHNLLAFHQEGQSLSIHVGLKDPGGAYVGSLGNDARSQSAAGPG